MGESEMTDLITEENVSVDCLRKILDAAYIEYSMTDKGDIRVKEHISVNVRPVKEHRTIKLFSIFGFKPSSTVIQRLESANKINVEYIIIRASIVNDVFWFEHELLLDGGLTPKGFIQAIKRFASIPIAAIKDHAADLVE